MRIDEFFLFKNKKNKPKEEVKKEKSSVEIFLDNLKKDAEPIKYEVVVEEFKKTFEKEFDEKIISDFKNAEWMCYDKDEDNVNEMLTLIPTSKYEQLHVEGENYGSNAQFYHFEVNGENNNLDILSILAWDYPVNDGEEENDYTYCLYVAIISTKANN